MNNEPDKIRKERVLEEEKLENGNIANEKRSKTKYL